MPKPPKNPAPRPPASRPGPPPANPRAPAQRRAALASHYRARFRAGGSR